MKIQLFSSDDKNQVVKDLKSQLNAHLADSESGPVDLVLYILFPDMKEFKLVIDLINDSNKQDKGQIGYYFFWNENEQLDHQSEHQLKSARAIGEMVKNNGGIWFESIDAIEEYVKAESHALQ